MRNYFSRVVVILFSQLIFVGNISSAQERIKLSEPNDYIISGASISLFFGGNYFYRNKTPLTETEINSLSISNINSFDRRATANYSHSAEKASDVMLVSSIALPAILSTPKFTFILLQEWSEWSLVEFRQSPDPPTQNYFHTIIGTLLVFLAFTMWSITSPL